MAPAKRAVPAVTADEHSLRQRARREAVKLLVDMHREEFEGLYERSCQAFGVEYTRKLTDAEKRKQQLYEMLDDVELRNVAREVLGMVDETTIQSGPE